MGFLDDMNFFVSDTPTGGGGAAGGAALGGTSGFMMSRDEMDTELKRLEDLRRRIEDQIQAAAPLWSIQSPGQGPASLRNTEAANNSGQYYRGHLLRQSGYLSTIITKMQNALGIVEETDAQAGKDIVKQGAGMEQGEGNF